MIWWGILILAVPTILKVIVDMIQIKDRHGIAHKTDIEEILILSAILVLIVSGLPSVYPYWIRLIQNGLMCFAIFLQFFDWTMGILLHGNPFYTGTGPDAAKTDGVFGQLGPINSTFIRLVVSAAAVSVMFHMDKIIG